MWFMVRAPIVRASSEYMYLLQQVPTPSSKDKVKEFNLSFNVYALRLKCSYIQLDIISMASLANL